MDVCDYVPTLQLTHVCSINICCTTASPLSKMLFIQTPLRHRETIEQLQKTLSMCSSSENLIGTYKVHVNIHTYVQSICDEKAKEYFYRTVKNREPPRIELGASDSSCQCSTT